jgi:PEP-CTERM motif-containing protein
MRKFFCGLTMLIAGSAVASAGMITSGQAGAILATDDIFFSGQSTIGISMGGTLPSFIQLVSGDISVTFSSITGTVNWCGGDPACNAGATGAVNPYATNGTNFVAGSDGAPGGVSGISFNGRVFFLVGMFTTDTAPGSSGPPTTLSYTSAPTGTISPALNQLFYVGGGAGETFVIPTNATHFYLGFADGLPGFSGTVGAYGDNSGSLTPTFSITAGTVPEPATFSLIGLGLASIGLLRKRIRR